MNLHTLNVPFSKINQLSDQKSLWCRNLRQKVHYMYFDIKEDDALNHGIPIFALNICKIKQFTNFWFSLNCVLNIDA